MSHKEVRKLFIDFFVKRGHKEYPSISLIPEDPTLLFTTAGMVQFKDAFLGKIKLNPPRACSIQKCLRTTDIEKIGKTLRHLTFFEMLGNFSFGDYFKKEAIYWGWEFLTDVMKIDKNRLYATVYEEDEEAYNIWKEILSEDRIYKLGKEDNFWEMGDTGPCGPCSEIIFDLGEDVGCGKKECDPGCDCDRFLEVWNLVFTQFEKKEDGSIVPLKQKNIDTGMGLERLLQVVTGKKSSFETELIHPIIMWLKENVSGDKIESLRIVADHLRSISFLIQEGIIPENSGRGYVLRRLLRRATFHLNLLGIKKPFLWKGIDVVAKIFKDVYPEIKEESERIKLIVKSEEERFLKTFESGLNRLYATIEELKEEGKNEIPGELVFKLYDTYGFPYEMVFEIGKELGMKVNIEEFHKIMEEAREKARVSWTGSGKEKSTMMLDNLSKTLKTDFEGYEKLETESKLIHLFKNGEKVEELNEEEEGEAIFEKTTFYGESGGQVGDTGEISSKDLIAIVLDTKKYESLIIHIIKVKKGKMKKGEIYSLKVNEERRKRIMANHTATHLLQAALRKVCGGEIKQAGSLVAPDRLRFDFTLTRNLTEEEIEKVEENVNSWIFKNYDVNIEITKVDEAKKKGALAFFGEKYGETVRVVKIGEPPISMELCGGTHVSKTGEIGAFKITSFQSISSGVKRIEAITRISVIEQLRKLEERLKEISKILKTQEENIEKRIQKLIDENKNLRKELEEGKGKIDVEKILNEKKEVNGIKYILKEIKTGQVKLLGNLIDKIKTVFNGVIILYSVKDNKIILYCGVTDDLKDRIKANEILKEISKLLGGNAGGRSDFAQGGGRKIENLNKIEEKLKNLLKQ